MNVYKKILFGWMIVLMGCVSCQEQGGLETRYLASSSTDVVLWCVQEDAERLTKSSEWVVCDTVVRGTEVRVDTSKRLRRDKVPYIAVFIGKNMYYVPESQTVENRADVVQETRVFVRTATSVIDDTITSHICGLAEKGRGYEVVSYEGIFSDGNVEKYKIRMEDAVGYVYAKYVVLDSVKAGLRYMATKYDSIHGKVRNPFGGGEAIGCDYYPVSKPVFAANEMPKSCYSLYLNISPRVIGNIDAYIDLAKQTKINTFVIDIKDNECPGYKADAMREFSPTNYKWAGKEKARMYENAVKRLHEEGFYVVGRITCFKDSYFVQDNPECAITERKTGQPFFHNKAYWPSAYDRRVWQFNVELAKESVRRFGFNEINFDYVRFPDKLQSVEDSIDYHNRYGESKVQAIQRFVQYAADEIHNVGAYVSIDVFGESANKGYTTPYGQYWPAISNVADVICGMPYPDHFADGYGGISKPWNNPYITMKTWGKAVQGRQAETTSPARVRTWIQAYPVLRYVDPNGIRYDANEVAQEIRGLFDAGLTDGYITWLSSSSLERYTLQAGAFAIDYLNDSISMPADLVD